MKEDDLANVSILALLFTFFEGEETVAIDGRHGGEALGQCGSGAEWDLVQGEGKCGPRKQPRRRSTTRRRCEGLEKQASKQGSRDPPLALTLSLSLCLALLWSWPALKDAVDMSLLFIFTTLTPFPPACQLPRPFLGVCANRCRSDVAPTGGRWMDVR